MCNNIPIKVKLSINENSEHAKCSIVEHSHHLGPQWSNLIIISGGVITGIK